MSVEADFLDLGSIFKSPDSRHPEVRCIMREYGLFLKVEKRYVRISKMGFPKAQAVRVFQSALLNYTMMGFNISLRPIKDTDLVSELRLVPSYGRDYKTPEEVLVDWESNKDFTVMGASVQCNKADAKIGNCALVFYDDRSKVTRINL